MNFPKAFISYSHDSLDHKKWVLELAIRLRNNGIDAVLDQWDLEPGDDIPMYMEKNLSNCDFTVMVCTTRYVEKANAGTGGVGYEKMIVTSQMMVNIDAKKIIPIIRQSGTFDVPTFLKTKLFIDFSLSQDFEFNFDNLLRALHKAPILTKPKLGSSPFTDTVINNENELPKHAEAILKVIIGLFEKGEEYNSREKILTAAKMSRIYSDLGLSLLSNKKYILLSSAGNYYLSNKGKQYAIDKEFVKI